MTVLGIILLVLGLLLPSTLLLVLGIILLVLGLTAGGVGFSGRPIYGRRHWY